MAAVIHWIELCPFIVRKEFHIRAVFPDPFIAFASLQAGTTIDSTDLALLDGLELIEVK
jgi:hypothetical protein